MKLLDAPELYIAAILGDSGALQGMAEKSFQLQAEIGSCRALEEGTQ